MNAEDAAGPLERLAEVAGIEPSFHDYFGRETRVSIDTKRAILGALGVAVDSRAEIVESSRKIDEAPWLRALEPVTVGFQGEPAQVGVTLPSDSRTATIRWCVLDETGASHEGSTGFAELPALAAKVAGDRTYERRALSLPAALPLGYHRLRLTGLGDASIIVAPRGCYLPPQAQRGERMWSLAVQLYSLRSRHNWGCGDFTDLRLLTRVAGNAGAAAVGVNPLHELDPANPAAASPYSPSSRFHLNVAYIDVEAVPDFQSSPEAQRRISEPSFSIRLAQLRAAPLVDYAGVAATKRPILKLLFAAFQQHHLARDTERARAFLKFVADGGDSLARLTAFEALSELAVSMGSLEGGWRNWPAEFRHPRSTGVRTFVAEHRDLVEFFAYLQWNADVQLERAARACGGMTIGLYHDLAVGAEVSGAETWSDSSVFAADASLGAPPDPLNELGQQWGLAPFNPIALRERAYEPFVRLIRANMRHAGALRIDHVMGLQRLFFIPAGSPPRDGAYVRFPFSDLLAIVALESQRNSCVVIGEDLGTLPEGFREQLQATNVLSCRLLYFEREPDGTVARPERYPIPAIVSPGTHDLPTLPAFWTGFDLALRARLGLLPRTLSLEDAEAHRARERTTFLEAFVGAGVLDATTAWRLHQAGGAAEPVDVRQLVVAAYRYLARSNALLLSASLEDILGVVDQINVPGTVAEHPNWQNKLGVPLEELPDDERFVAVTSALEERARRSVVPPSEEHQ